MNTQSVVKNNTKQPNVPLTHLAVGEAEWLRQATWGGECPDLLCGPGVITGVLTKGRGRGAESKRDVRMALKLGEGPGAQERGRL